MKKILLGLLVICSLKAYSQEERSVNIASHGFVSMMNYEVISDKSFITISGDVAKKIWNDMVLVNISPANQYQPNDMKQGDGIKCELISKTQEVLCHLLLNSAEGIVRR